MVHAAGVLDDGVIDYLTPEQVERVFAPKVDAAWHLHELTRHLDLRAFVMFSSVAGVLGIRGRVITRLRMRFWTAWRHTAGARDWWGRRSRGDCGARAAA